MSIPIKAGKYRADERDLLSETQTLISELKPVQAFSSRIAQKVFVYSCLLTGVVLVMGYSYLWFTQVRTGVLPIQRLLPLPVGLIMVVTGLIYLYKTSVPRYAIWFVVLLVIVNAPIGLALNGPIGTTFLLAITVFFHLILKPKEALITFWIIFLINAGFVYLVFPPEQVEIPQRLLINSLIVVSLMQIFSRTLTKLVEDSRKSIDLLNTQAFNLEQALKHAAVIDPTSKVYNSTGLHQAISQFCESARENYEKACLVAFRINYLQQQPRQLGLEAEATFYGMLMDRVRQFLPIDGVIGRIGQNDFVFLLPHTNISIDVVMNKCRYIQKSINSPLQLSNRKIGPDIRMGIVSDIRRDLGSEILLQQAMLAMHEATQDISKSLVLYDKNIDERLAQRRRITAALETAIVRNEMQVCFQPIVDLKTGKSTKAEALLRWNSADLGEIGPEIFIPLAEASNQIRPLTEFVLKTVYKQKQYWNTEFGRSPEISVNISPITLQDPDELLEILDQCYSPDPKSPKGLNIEVTEGLQITATKQTNDIIKDLKARGYQTSFDDFGTGYSSLAYLSRFPVDFLKIDKSFLQEIERDHVKESVVIAIIQVAHQLGIQVIAEGIETEQQRSMLLKAGCDFGQGYLFSRPQNPDEFARQWLSQQPH